MCDLCPELVKSRNKIVKGELMSGPPQILVVAEAPGVEEDRTGRPLMGISGQEARHHLAINGMLSNGVYLDNIIQCHPTENRDPTTEEIMSCTDTNLIPLILQLQPKYILSMGRISTRFFLGDVTLEEVHGIPRPISVLGHETILIPTYHPAAGLHSPKLMLFFQKDMVTAGHIIRGKIKSYPIKDEKVEDYKEIDDVTIIQGAPVVAIDTEGTVDKPYCLSISVTPGQAFVIMPDQATALNAALNDTTVVMHSALYDLPILAKMGIYPKKIMCTMVMAYLLQDEPQGLKTLAFRHCGMKMDSYPEIIKDATQEKAMNYLIEAMKMEWPDPDPVLEWKKGEPYIRQPQNIKRRIQKIIDKEDIYNKWRKMSGTEQVEAVLGRLEEADLSDLDKQDAIYYSARDADATIRIYPILWERIKENGLEETFWRDMSIIPMVVDMMANGMPINISAFHSLSNYFQSQMDLIQQKMQLMVGHLLQGRAINPASAPQMATLIYDKLKLIKGNRSTAIDVLRQLQHPIISDIINWREYQKLKTSYADVIPRQASNGKIRTTLRITRTTTGRLSSSSPNLMAQPTRSEEGRKVRNCFVAEDGCVFLSCDYSTIEMRVAANDSKDEQMMKVFWEGKDIHSQTASDMFGIPINQVDEMKHRYPAKRVGFGILNLITAKGLQRELSMGGTKWSISACEEMIKSWFEIYRGVAAYMKANGEYAKRYGYVRDMWGRIRYIPGIRSSNRWIRIEAERQAGNSPIQMGAQGIIKDAMGRLIPIYRKLNQIGKVEPLIQIHDDIVWQVSRDILPVAINKIKKEMEIITHPDFVIPLSVGVKVGKRWGSMKEI